MAGNSGNPLPRSGQATQAGKASACPGVVLYCMAANKHCSLADELEKTNIDF